MRNLQKVWLVIITILLLLPLIPPKTFSKDTIPKRRIVTLIYDDSGSMWNGAGNMPIDNWKYANYALQSLVGLLDSNDLLNVIPMSNPKVSREISLGENNRQKQIEEIRTWSGKKSTPIETISTMINQVNAYSTEFPEAEYWTIILTDGVFVELDPNFQNNTETRVSKIKTETEHALTKLTQRMTAKNITFNNVLVTIESNLSTSHKEIMNDFKKLWVRSTNGTIIESDSEGKIVESINQVAALMTNRDPDETKLFQLNAQYINERITLTSPLPLRRLTVLHQSIEENETIMIEDALINGKQNSYSIEGPYTILSPKDPYDLNPTIQATITHIKQGQFGEVIPEGEYELIFKSPMQLSQIPAIRFLAEPAVDFNLSVQKVNLDGTLSNNKSSFTAGSKMLLSVELIQSESKQPINLDNVQKDIFHLTSLVGDKSVDMIWDEKRKVFAGEFNLMEKEVIKAAVKVQIEGLYQKEKEIQFAGLPLRQIELKRANDRLWKSKVDQLEQAKPIEVIPFIDGIEISEQELSEIFSQLKISSPGHRIDFKLSQEDNHFFIQPLTKGTVLSTSTGKVPVHVTLTGKSSPEHADLIFDIQIEDVAWYVRYGWYFFWLLIALIILIYFYGVTTKARFASNRISITYERYLLIGDEKVQQGPSSTENFHTNFLERWLIPYRAEKKSIQGIVFKATKNPDQVLLPKQSQNQNMTVAGTELLEDSGKYDKYIFSNDEIIMENFSYIEIYTLKTS
jgi:hypothetical protein